MKLLIITSILIVGGAYARANTDVSPNARVYDQSSNALDIYCGIAPSVSTPPGGMPPNPILYTEVFLTKRRTNGKSEVASGQMIPIFPSPSNGPGDLKINALQTEIRNLLVPGTEYCFRGNWAVITDTVNGSIIYVDTDRLLPTTSVNVPNP